MFKSYLKTAWRTLFRHKGATLIKLAGLSIGMACCLLIVVYIDDELSYNTFHAHYADIYRVNFVKHGDGETRVMSGTPNSAGPAIAKDLTQVAAVGRRYTRAGILEVKENADSPGKITGGSMRKRFQEQNIDFADQGLLNVLTAHFVQGNAATALTEPGSIVITGEMARKYFGREDVVGRTMIYENSAALRVTGIMDAWPANSDLHVDGMISFETLYSVETKGVADFLRTNWLYNPAETYVRLKPGVAVAAVAPALAQLTRKYGDERVQKYWRLALQPLSELHLYASNVEGNPSTNSITYIYIFSGIALLILLIATINFINLSNAQSLTRIAEIGVRQVSGAGRRQLLIQFLGEGLLLSLFAFVLALALMAPGLKLLDTVTGKTLGMAALGRGGILLVFAGLLLGTGLLAGIYPALFITRFQLTRLLKGLAGESRVGSNRIRQSLIVTQFAIAIALMIGAIVIQRQLNFLRNKPLGFDKEQLLVLPLFGKNPSPINSGVDGPLRARMNSFENDLRAMPAVRGVTVSSVLPGDFFVSGLVIPEGHVEQDNIFIPWASVDYNFVGTMGLALVAGRDFSKATGTDHLQAFIINESALRTFGWTSAQEAIGKSMIRGDASSGKKGHVIGVVKDFNFGRLDRPQQPMIMDVNVPRFTEFAVRIGSAGVPATIAGIQRSWNQYFPERVFEYSFLDENIEALYNAQANLSLLIRYFALIAVVLSCIGLFGLASYMAMQRTREIGIRKVLGASVGGLVALLYRDFLRLVVLALLISTPLAWWAMDKWLHDFAYRIGLSWWIFAGVGVIVVVVSLVTVGIQGLRAARVNPVRSLRSL